jgi:hypothetical protein
MRALPPFGVVFATLQGILISVTAWLAPFDIWLKVLAPRAAAEDAIAQARYIIDAECRWTVLDGWGFLISRPSAEISFEYAYGHAAGPPGKLLALAGLRALHSRHYRARFIEQQSVPEVAIAILGPDSVQHVGHRSLLAQIESGHWPRLPNTASDTLPYCHY